MQNGCGRSIANHFSRRHRFVVPCNATHAAAANAAKATNQNDSDVILARHVSRETSTHVVHAPYHARAVPLRNSCRAPGVQNLSRSSTLREPVTTSKLPTILNENGFGESESQSPQECRGVAICPRSRLSHYRAQDSVPFVLASFGSHPWTQNRGCESRVRVLPRCFARRNVSLGSRENAREIRSATAKYVCDSCETKLNHLQVLS